MLASPLFHKMPLLGLEILALVLGDVGLVEVPGGYGREWFGDGGCDDTDGGHSQSKNSWECEAHCERGFESDIWVVEDSVCLDVSLRRCSWENKEGRSDLLIGRSRCCVAVELAGSLFATLASESSKWSQASIS